MNDRHISGVNSELIAQEYFTLNGCVVSKPLSHFAEYDLLVDNSEFISRIQVKTIYKYMEKGKPRYKCNLERSKIRANNVRFQHRYDENSFDILCAVEPTTRNIYLIPVKDIIGKCAMFFYPHSNLEDKRHKNEKFRFNNIF